MFGGNNYSLFVHVGFVTVTQAEGFWPPEAVMDMLKKIDVKNLELEEQDAVAQKPAADRLA